MLSPPRARFEAHAISEVKAVSLPGGEQLASLFALLAGVRWQLERAPAFGPLFWRSWT
jgi:hypothetical protein